LRLPSKRAIRTYRASQEKQTWKAKEGDDGDTRGDGTCDRIGMGSASFSQSASKEEAITIVFWTKDPSPASKEVAQQYRWFKTYEDALNYLREKNTGVCNKTIATVSTRWRH
jgi:hypothetical protein